MKNIKKYLSILVMALLFNACHNLDEINDNPNYVNETHPQLLLTEIASNAFQVEGTRALYASRMIIQTGEENNYQFYKWGNGSFAPYNELRQVTKMIEEAQRIENSNYVAIGKFFRAYYFYKLSLSFGDIPYSEALAGETGNYQPGYDSQERVFAGIINELDEAAGLINDNETIDGDIIYNGNPINWLKLINSFQLKVLMTLSGKEQAEGINISEKFNEVYQRGNLINSLDENAQLVFVDQQDSRYTEFNSSSYASSMFMSATFVDLLKELKDNRLFIIAEQTSSATSEAKPIEDFESYNGGDPTANYSLISETLVADGNISKVNARYYTNPTTEPHNILSYWEIEYILAEATVREWINSDASQHYENAVRANFEFYRNHAEEYNMYLSEAYVNQYLSQENVKLPVADKEVLLERILTQKYLTSFLQGGWTQYYDYLRTGYPYFKFTNANTPPKRFVYPNDEYNNNTRNLEEAINSQFNGNDGIRETPWWLN